MWKRMWFVFRLFQSTFLFVSLIWAPSFVSIGLIALEYFPVFKNFPDCQLLHSS